MAKHNDDEDTSNLLINIFMFVIGLVSGMILGYFMYPMVNELTTYLFGDSDIEKLSPTYSLSSMTQATPEVAVATTEPATAPEVAVATTAPATTAPATTATTPPATTAQAPAAQAPAAQAPAAQAPMPAPTGGQLGGRKLYYKKYRYY